MGSVEAMVFSFCGLVKYKTTKKWNIKCLKKFQIFLWKTRKYFLSQNLKILADVKAAFFKKRISQKWRLILQKPMMLLYLQALDSLGASFFEFYLL